MRTFGRFSLSPAAKALFKAYNAKLYADMKSRVATAYALAQEAANAHPELRETVGALLQAEPDSGNMGRISDAVARIRLYAYPVGLCFAEGAIKLDAAYSALERAVYDQLRLEARAARASTAPSAEHD
ncbi:MAG: hypothetical protein KC492_21260 [Myxococcales bacterium]|nr:hypothetical protein [Myxococcales bacterium]